MNDPNGSTEWQEAVDLAQGFLDIEDARAYGLITGGPVVDIGRCEELLARGAERGFRPRPDAGAWLTVLLSRQTE